MPRTEPSTQQFTADELTRRTIIRRAIEAINWAIPAVNYDLMFQALLQHGGAYNQIVYWPGLPSWKNQTLTPNPDVIYLMPFFTTKDVGPMVIEIPRAGAEGSITGTIQDSWQAALEDVGPAGADRGKGGKYLVLPPGHKGKVPDGYIVLPSDTYRGYALLRSVLKSGSMEDVANAVAYARQIKLYPQSQAGHPHTSVFVDVLDSIFDSTIPYDLRFFQSIDSIVQYEPWLSKDKVMIDTLTSIGIEKGKPFAPDWKTQEMLGEAAREARAWFDLRYETAFAPYYDDSHWFLPVLPGLVETQGTFFEGPDSYSVDDRGLAFYFAFSTIKHMGAGQFYLMTIKDVEGRSFEGRHIYRLTVPPNAPVNQYWSATVYDRATHTFIRNLPRASRSSQTPGLQRNQDGSVDIYFGQTAPEGRQMNWVPTNPDGEFEVLFRFYGPEKPVFDKSWRLLDIVKV